ncbi:hypothetical protein [Bacteroides sp.]|uniref:hypothetical protein n=1 Tax=Bacteroides sp. TaxID=29523 RepID=UPI002606B99B|nr:hypothetical protein [Bacteroides sp.]MDD3040152.1 hypothetical protein [Bacteroides sp.]
MKDWMKSYWSNCLSIAAIIFSIVAICVSLPSSPELGIDYIGVIVGILSFLVTLLIGWQIYNAVTIEKRIKSEVELVKDLLNKSIDKARKDLSLSNSRALTEALFKQESNYLDSCLATDQFYYVELIFEKMFKYATLLNDPLYYRIIASDILYTYNVFFNQHDSNKDYQFITKPLLEISQKILAHLPISEDQDNIVLLISELLKNKAKNQDDKCDDNDTKQELFLNE